MSDFLNKLKNILDENGLEYVVGEDECCSDIEIVKIKYKIKWFSVKVYAKTDKVFFANKTYDTTDETLDKIIEYIGEQGTENRKKIVKGQRIYAKTNADFLNQLFGTDYKQYMKCTYPISCQDDTLVFFLSFDGIKKSSGWRNFISGDCFIEKCDALDDLAIRDHACMPSFRELRVTFNKINTGSGFMFEFMGVYQTDKEKTEPTRRVWNRVSDEFSL